MSTEVVQQITVNPKILTQLIGDCLLQKITPMVWGMPGIGKSEIMRDLADEWNLELVDVRLTTCDITDLNGFPDNRGEKATYKVFDTFPIQGDKLPKGKDGWLVFLDELPSVNASMQASAYKLILDRMVGKHHLHDRVVLAAAGNDTNHGAISYGMGTAAGTRMVHFNLESNLKDWVEWATKANVDHRIISFVQYRPELFHSFNSDSNDKTHPNPRTWVATSRLVKRYQDLNIDYHLPLAAGCVGEGAGREFISYSQVYKDLVNFSDIVRDPANCRIPVEAANKYALTGVIINSTTPANVERVIDYLARLPFEFQVITMRGVINKVPELTENDKFSDWMSDIVIELT